MHERSKTPSSLTERVVHLVIYPSKHIPTLIVLAYVTAVLGLGIGFVGGIERPTGYLGAVGLGLLAVSFGVLFYVSVMVVNIHGGGGR